MRLALAIASILVLIIHALVFWNQFFHPWEKYQTAYFDQARGLAKTDAERSALDARSPKIEQILVTQFGEMRVDRCMTCHIAADDPRFSEYAHPLKSHPFSEAMGDRKVNDKWERRHKFSEFGCTVCHDGQGRGLKTFYAHGEDHYWPDPMSGYTVQHNWLDQYKPKLKGKEYLEANCAQCHTRDDFAGTPTIAKGKKLFFEKNCYGCHRIDGISSGTLAPDLTEVGKKFKVDYLWESVVNPRANIATSFMPKFTLKDDEIRALVVFLKSRRGMNFAETSLERFMAQKDVRKIVPDLAPEGAAPPATPVSRGEQLLTQRACIACHKVGNVDGGIAPDLSFEGLMKNEEWMMAHFKDPRSRMSDSIMPSFGFPDDEYRDMTEYLKTLKTPPPINSPAETYQNLCQRCHGEKGDGLGPIAVYLDPSPRDLTKSSFMVGKSPDRFLNSIKEGVPGTSMPSWKQVLTDDQIRSLIEYVRQSFVKEPWKELKARNVPDQNPVPSSPQSIQLGGQTFTMRCAGCHGRKADGKGPNSLDINPRPRNLRNAEFVNALSDRRMYESIMYGVQGTAMPPWIDYGMTQTDVGNLMNYIRGLNQRKK